MPPSAQRRQQVDEVGEWVAETGGATATLGFVQALYDNRSTSGTVDDGALGQHQEKLNVENISKSHVSSGACPGWRPSGTLRDNRRPVTGQSLLPARPFQPGRACLTALPTGSLSDIPTSTPPPLHPSTRDRGPTALISATGTRAVHVAVGRRGACKQQH
ncbi:hypothetical protein E4U54_001323 [Claviceps lovelessii]|nr:hypothetical protein E4U54_001323 [Claviceps lovelessii]